MTTDGIIPIRPSEVTDFQRCARYWFYKHCEGWRAPDSAWEPWQLLGSAVHAGLAEWWRIRKNYNSLVPDTLRTETSAQVLSNTLAQGWPPTAPPEFSYEELESLALKVLDATLTWIGTHMADAEPVLVEHTLREDGCTPDLVTKEQDQLVVTDWKTHWNLDADRVRHRLEGLDRTHQFLDYAWAVGQHLGEPIAMVRKVVIVGSPRIIVKDATWPVSQSALDQWLISAQQLWQDMEQVRAGERVASMNPNGCKMYGDKYPCTYWEACWTCHGDREKMAQFLVKQST